MKTLQAFLNIVWLILSFLLEKDNKKKEVKGDLLKEAKKAVNEKDEKECLRKLLIVINDINRLRK